MTKQILHAKIHYIIEVERADGSKDIRYLCNQACGTTLSKSTTNRRDVTCKNCKREIPKLSIGMNDPRDTGDGQHGKAFCDWAGNRTMYDGCQPTETQEKEIAIILLGNRRDFASPKIEGGEKEAVA